MGDDIGRPERRANSKTAINNLGCWTLPCVLVTDMDPLRFSLKVDLAPFVNTNVSSSLLGDRLSLDIKGWNLEVAGLTIFFGLEARHLKDTD